MLAFALLTFQINAQTYTFSTGLDGWNTAYGAAGPVTHSTTEGTNGDGALVLTRENNNSNFGLNPAGIDANTKNYIRIRFKNETNGTQLRVQGSQPADNSDLKLANTVFPIAPNSTEYVTMYLDMSSTNNWANTIDNFDVLLRTNYASGEGSFYLDEIEFLTASASITGILQNPSFEDFGGQLAPWALANQTFATITPNNDFANEGTFSLKHEYSAVPDATHFVFNNYIHDLGSTTSNNVTASLWVKVVRPSTPGISPLITIQGQSRTGTTVVVGDLITQSISGVTTKTDGTWEELTYSFPPEAAYSTVQFRYGILLDNLQAGDIVYIDNLAAEISATASTKNLNAFEFSMYPNPVINELIIKTQESLKKVEIYNLLGKKVLISENVTNSIDVSSLSSSIYLVKLTSDKGVSIKKLVKN